jgi:hypothetical protein
LFTLYFFGTATREGIGALWERRKFWMVYGYYFFLAVTYLGLTSVAVYVSAQNRAQAIKEPGAQSSVEVRYRTYSDSADPVSKPGLALIGATQKVVFFYDVNAKHNEKDNHTLVIPQAQIVSIKVPD